MIAATALDSGGVSNASSATTNSITPKTNQLILLYVLNKGPNNTAANLPTLSGIAITWGQVLSHASSFSSGEWRGTLWAGVLPSAASGTITIDCAGQSQQSLLWGIIQLTYSKIDRVNPQNGIKQSVAAENNSSISSFSVTLSSFASINNATVGFFGNDGQASWVAGGNFNSVVNATPPSGNLLAEFAANNQTTVNTTFAGGGSNSTGKIGIAVEVIFQPPAGIIGDI